MGWLSRHGGALLTTYLLSLLFFHKFVRPAVGTAFPDAGAFIIVSALVHTIAVGAGFAVADRGAMRSFLF